MRPLATAARVLATAAVLAPLAPARPAAAEEPGTVSLAIVEPEPGRYVTGPVTLRARVEPPDARVARVAFAVDGEAVCTRDAPPWECAWDAGPGVEAHGVRAVATLADGTRVVDSVRTEAATFAPFVDVEVVQVAATVTDGGGRRVRGLGREAFRVLEDGRPQSVTYFEDPSAPRELVVAVDMSASMSQAMPQCRTAVKGFLQTLRPIDHVTVLAFNDAVFTASRRDAAPEARLRAVDRLRGWGSTALFDAILKGLSLLDTHRGRRALVVFTDGEDLASRATAADVERRVDVSATPVYLVAQGRGLRDPALKHVLDRVARVSGGRAFYTDDVGQLGGAFAEIAEELDAQYLLAYEPDGAGAEGGWRTIHVEVSRQGTAVRARQGYRAAGRER